jgi:transcriptional regulator with XRE-family HTH domain
MESQCPVAQFVRQQILMLGKSQVEIAQQVGFEKPNVITMIKQGRTKLPMTKVTKMAEALETDPVYLLKLCMQEYQPDNWEVIEPLLEHALTNDERTMLYAWRRYVSAPYVAALKDESKVLLQEFLLSLKSSPIKH